jgi:hypothetical protein
MCGRYAQSRNVHQLQLAFGLPEEALDQEGDPEPAWAVEEALVLTAGVACNDGDHSHGHRSSTYRSG